MCIKHCAFGTVAATRLSHDEVIRRLKRWHITGGQPGYEGRWPVEEQRTYHVHYTGGRRLHELASDLPQWAHVSDADLDRMCRNITTVGARMAATP